MKKILLVDDSVITLRKVKHVIEKIGIHICELAEDGLKALKVLEIDSDFCLIITDIHMPHMDGLELIKEIKKRKIEIPLLVCTADIQIGTKEKALAYGATQVVNKPDLFDEKKAKQLLTDILLR